MAALAAVYPRSRREELSVLFLGLFVPGREGGWLPGGAEGTWSALTAPGVRYRECK